MSRIDVKSQSSRPEVWDAAAWNYEATREGDPMYAACVELAVRSVLGRARGGTLLDAGCGTGLATTRLASRFKRCVALDFSAESLSVLAGKGPAHNLSLLQGDLTRLPFADASFDAVLCANTLQHLAPGEPQRRAAAELRRVARPGAPIVVTVHHFSHIKQRLGWKKEGKPGQAGIDYIFRFTGPELIALFPQASIRSVGFGPLARWSRLSRVTQPLATELVGGLAAKLGHGHMLLAIERK